MKYIYKYNRCLFSIFLVFLFLVCFTDVRAAIYTKQVVITVQINGPTQPPGFSPAFLTLHVNDTVVFINHAFPARSYMLSADDGSFSSPPIPSGGQWAITFHKQGSHSYRDTSATSTMVGELMVVAKHIRLLATPDPRAEATALAFIHKGQNPPDSITLPKLQYTTTSPAPNSLMPMLILGIGITISVLLLSFLGITFYRRRARSMDDDLDDELTLLDDDIDNDEHVQQIRTIIANARKKLQTHMPFKASKSDDDDY